MKLKLFSLIIPAFLSAYPFYFADENGIYRLVGIEYKGKIRTTKKVKRKIYKGIYEVYNKEVKVYEYTVYTSIKRIRLFCERKINFRTLRGGIDIFDTYRCWEVPLNGYY